VTDNIGRSPEAWRNYTTKVPIAAFRMKRDDLKRLYQIINNKQVEYRDKLLGNLFKVPPESDEGFAARKQKVHDAFVTSVSITGLDGEIVTGNNEAFFESSNVPANTICFYKYPISTSSNDKFNAFMQCCCVP
jgi:hypothetical protein